jgi:hypothetical protein
VIATDFSNFDFFDKLNNYFNVEEREKLFLDRIAAMPVLKDLSSVGSFYANFLYSDESISPTTLINTNSFFMFPIIFNVALLEDSYDFIKNLNQLYNINHKVFLHANTNFFAAQAYSYVFDMFRSDVEDFF